MTDTVAREEAKRALLGYVHPSARHVDPDALIQADPLPRAFVDGFIAGAEWGDAQVAELLPTLAKALEYRMSWIHDSGHIPKFGDDWRACKHQRCEETRYLMARALSDPGEASNGD